MQNQILDTIYVKEVEPEVRLSDFLVDKSIHLPSKKSIKKALKKGLVYKNKKLAHSGDFVQVGDVLELIKEDVPVKKIFKLDIEVVFEDDEIAVVNKPAGFPVSGNYFKTIENALPHNLVTSKSQDALDFFRPIHRLDNPTSGLLIVAKTKSARVFLGQELEKGGIQKGYSAIVQGEICEKGTISIPINRQKATTHFEVLASVPSLRSVQLSQIQVGIETGRTHQIRKHVSAIGHPILGDKIYGTTGNILLDKGLFLCSNFISLRHPKTLKLMTFHIDPPNKFATQLNKEKMRFEKFN